MSGPIGRKSIRGPQAAAAGELPAGAVVGEYRIKRRIAEGGMATVYAGIHPLIHKKVAIKIMRPVDHGRPEAVERFIREARIVNQISHPSIVDVIAFGQLPDGRCYLVMDWLDGETLGARLRRERIPFEEALDILVQIVDALAAAHDKEVIHRDVKPENIHLVPVGKKRVAAKLLDFGISTLLVDEGPPEATGQRQFIGTPKYTSPEQAGGVVGDTRSDVYSLGVTAFELFVGRAPFEGEQPSDLLRAQLTELPPAPSTVWPEIPLQLERLLVQMLDKNPERRPLLADVAARLGELRTAVARSAGQEDPTDVHGVPSRTSATRWLVTLGAVAGLGAVGVGWWLERAAGERAESIEAAAVPATAGEPRPATVTATAEARAQAPGGGAEAIAAANAPTNAPAPSPNAPTTNAPTTNAPTTNAPTTTAPAPTTTAPAPTTTASSPTTTASSPTTTAPSPTTTAPSPTTNAPAPTTTAPSPATAAAAAPAAKSARLQVDVDVRSLIRVDGHVVARGRRAALEVTPGIPHLLVVASPPRAAYREKVVVGAGSTIELAVRLGAAHPSARLRPSRPPSSPPASAPQPGDPNYTLNPFPAR